ncbi:TetR/AcrR family transcriptional regulator [Oscillospiraceae bacterium 38-13]
MARNKHPEETVRKILDTAERLFVEKGYDRTSLQDIIMETGLSKGAIYHHFTSKEDIFYSVCALIGQRNSEALTQLRDDSTLNGLEKLRSIPRLSLQLERQANTFSMMPYLKDNAKFLAMEVRSIYEEVVPLFIEPIILQGIADGSIHTSHPRALAEALVLLSDIWLNPIVQPTTREEVRARCAIYNQLFHSFGIEELIDEEIARILEAYADMPRPSSPEGESHA